MANTSVTPQSIRRACDLLRDAGICRIVENVVSLDDAQSQLKIEFDIQHPNQEGLPASAKFICAMDHPYPYGEVHMVPIGDEVTGFPHQAADGGKLCFPPSYDAPWDETRLLKYVEWTREWLSDAANGRLLFTGQPYELPDFRLRTIPDASLKQVPPILFDESSATFAVWKDRIGQTGNVSLEQLKSVHGIAATRWFGPDKAELHRSSFSRGFLKGSTAFHGRWVLLPKMTASRHRPPRTLEELGAICQASHVSLEKVLRRAWADSRIDLRCGVILLGFPIPHLFGDPPTEIHWQPMLLPNRDATQREYRGRGKRDEGLLWNYAYSSVLAPSRSITWGKCVNVARERQYARGAAPNAVADRRIVIMGAGAIGSLLAEFFTRAGIRDLSLFDDDQLEFGNLCRHSLDGTHVGKKKAAALAARLSSANPLSAIRAFGTDVPFPEIKNSEAIAAISECDVLIDSSTDHGAFLWASDLTRHQGKRFASLFINSNATLLTIVLSGRNTTANKVFKHLNREIAEGRTAVDADEYVGRDADTGLVLPGPGCWHPTFPARNNHIAMLIAAGVDMLYKWAEAPYRCDGRAVVIRRRDASPMIEIALDLAIR